jgi:hypothetical protein
LIEKLRSGSLSEWETIFRTPLDGFDMLIELKPDAVPSFQSQIFLSQQTLVEIVQRKPNLESFKNLPLSNVLIDFDPIHQYVSELEV